MALGSSMFGGTGYVQAPSVLSHTGLVQSSSSIMAQPGMLQGTGYLQSPIVLSHIGLVQPSSSIITQPGML